MRRFLCNLISVIFSLVRLSVLKLFHYSSLHFWFVERISPNVVIEINDNSKLYLGKNVRVHSGCKIKARKNAKLRFGDDVKMNYNCIVISKEEISIGEGTEFGPGVLIYDHDHDYRKGLKNNEFITSAVHIGKRCWIGANTVILKGTRIGDDCVIAAGSIIRGDIPNNSLVYQKKELTIKEI